MLMFSYSLRVLKDKLITIWNLFFLSKKNRLIWVTPNKRRRVQFECGFICGTFLATVGATLTFSFVLYFIKNIMKSKVYELRPSDWIILIKRNAKIVFTRHRFQVN